MMLCRICGQVTTCKRYGIPSCAACGAFFWRSVKRNLKYHCNKDQDCNVFGFSKDKQLCKFCRLQKCFTVGMQATRIERMSPPATPVVRPCKESPESRTFAAMLATLLDTCLREPDLFYNYVNGFNSQLLERAFYRFSCLPDPYTIPFIDKRLHEQIVYWSNCLYCFKVSPEELPHIFLTAVCKLNAWINPLFVNDERRSPSPLLRVESEFLQFLVIDTKRSDELESFTHALLDPYLSNLSDPRTCA